MGRPRKKNFDFPQGLQFRHGKYYYTIGGRWLNLGPDRDEAVRVAENMNKVAREDRLAAAAFEREATAELRRMVFARDGDCCVYCGATERLGLDHVIPAETGGATTMRNLVVSCEECNGSKSDLDLAAFFVKLHRTVERYLETKLGPA